MRTWTLVCSACGTRQAGSELSTVCPQCGQPFLVEYPVLTALPKDIGTRWDMWRYAPLLPLQTGEAPTTLGEGGTPLLEAKPLSESLSVARVQVKEEGLNPTGSFKARGMSAAVTRARAFGIPGLTCPTAGNAGAALAAYGAAAGLPVRVFAPSTTPRAITETIRALGSELTLVDGHIGDAGKQARAFAAESGYFDVSTLREPYRIEGKKTMGLEIAEQLSWHLPTHIIYPTGGGTGLIGMWKAFKELAAMGWLQRHAKLPRMIVAQAEGCAPIVRAFAEGAEQATPWANPETHAAGLRVPGPLGDRLILRAVRESGGDAVSVSEEEIRSGTEWLAGATGIDAAPEGGAAAAVLRKMVTDGRIPADAHVVLFNTGTGASYRS